MVSSVDEFANGSFQTLIDDEIANPKDIKTLVLLTGKFYYDLLEEKEAQNRKDVALVRIEQLFPLPTKAIQSILEKYKNADDIVWAQEEPRNMGAYAHMLMHLDEAKQFRYAGRRPYGAPAAGSSTRSKRRHKEVIDYVFDKTKSNQR